MSKPLKVMTIFGTRPEIIRLSAILEKLDGHCDHVMVHTGQNYDYTLNQVSSGCRATRSAPRSARS